MQEKRRAGAQEGVLHQIDHCRGAHDCRSGDHEMRHSFMVREPQKHSRSEPDDDGRASQECYDLHQRRQRRGAQRDGICQHVRIKRGKIVIETERIRDIYGKNRKKKIDRNAYGKLEIKKIKAFFYKRADHCFVLYNREH